MGLNWISFSSQSATSFVTFAVFLRGLWGAYFRKNFKWVLCQCVRFRKTNYWCCWALRIQRRWWGKGVIIRGCQGGSDFRKRGAGKTLCPKFCERHIFVFAEKNKEMSPQTQQSEGKRTYLPKVSEVQNHCVKIGENDKIELALRLLLRCTENCVVSLIPGLLSKWRRALLRLFFKCLMRWTGPQNKNKILRWKVRTLWFFMCTNLFFAVRFFGSAFGPNSIGAIFSRNHCWRRNS